MGFLDFLKSLFSSQPQPASPRAERSLPSQLPTTAVSKEASRKVSTLSLDASQFTPLSEKEVAARSSGRQLFVNGWGGWEFGRRDRIPSAADARTKLIDQAMVGQGLITPEELVEIHTLGEQMELLRPDLSTASRMADKAVEADRAERARIKAEKKVAAEQRERDRKTAVAHRHATDILFLGRGVSKGLADRRSHIETLKKLGIPVLSTPADLAAALSISIPRLRWLAFHAEASTVSHYIQFQVPKKSGGTRTVSAPHTSIASTQQWVLTNILAKLPTHAAAHGFVPGRSIVTNAQPHIGSAIVINVDLTDFFPTVTVHRVIGVFKAFGYSPAVATLLALLITECPRRKVTFNGQLWHVATGPRGLPQGACTSPAISNLISRRLDARLTGLATKLGLRYTRYADDLTLSSPTPLSNTGYLLARLRHIASDEGFAINEKKTRVLKQAARQTVTGVVTNVHPSTPRKLRRQLRAILHNAGKTSLALQNRSGDPRFVARVAGQVEFVSMVNPKQGKPLQAALGKAT